MFTPVAHRPRGSHGHVVSSSETIEWVKAVVAEKGGEGCRDWPGCRNDKGYGQLWHEGRGRQVGHLVLELSGRPQPKGAHQLHSCDRPPCAAPWHLRWGTNHQNRMESVARDRHSRGERTPNSKLTDGAVREIRTSTAALDELAAKFGVRASTVQKAMVGLTWKHVDTPPIAGGRYAQRRSLRRCAVDESGKVGVVIEDGHVAEPAPVHA